MSARKGTSNLFTYALVTAAFFVTSILINAGGLSASLKGQLVPICAYIVLTISLNLTVGVLGELSLGHAGFMSIGAFTGVIASFRLDVTFTPLRLALAIVVGAICAGVAGVLIGVPILRLKGDYLAIVTLAFCEIIKNILNCFYAGIDNNGLRIGFLTGVSSLKLGEGARVIVDGPMGISGIMRISTFTSGYILILVTLFITFNLTNSRLGRAIMALRDSRIAAESVGVEVTRHKLIVFTISSMMAGAAGALYGLNYSAIVASKFNFNTSILILVFVVLGGLGNMWGSVIAATVLTVLPETLRGLSDYRMLIYAVVLIIIMLATGNDEARSLISRASPAHIFRNSTGTKGERRDG